MYKIVIEGEGKVWTGHFEHLPNIKVEGNDPRSVLDQLLYKVMEVLALQ
jgi:hypothetical protein